MVNSQVESSPHLTVLFLKDVARDEHAAVNVPPTLSTWIAMERMGMYYKAGFFTCALLAVVIRIPF